ncbi:UrcA family protein [Sphingomonas sp.]|uniref:UrcA family protein n=1 Tax=Sphingomonas sp. TaxID=28214 RepID=UPI0031DB9AE4
MSKIIAAAFAASVFMCGASVEAQMREPITVKVHYADLNLARADQRAVLDARIRRAANSACGPITVDIASNADVLHCRKEMHADAAVKLAGLSPAPIALASNR